MVGLREDTEDAEHRFAHRLARVDRVLREEQRDAQRVERLVPVDDHVELATEPAYARHDDAAEPAGLGIGQEP
ncbi:MAG TPA: hypothetical protein VKB09_08335, partial [Thermomicrobiales bacterium]|nr:hypothetical protein [Thermomicrobiales bacterium]